MAQQRGAAGRRRRVAPQNGATGWAPLSGAMVGAPGLGATVGRIGLGDRVGDRVEIGLR